MRQGIPAVSLLLLLVAACAQSLPPQDLLDARTSYAEAERSFSHHDSKELSIAKQQLDVAESLFASRGDTLETRDAAYIAVRKAEYAESTARTAVAIHDKEQADQDLRITQLPAVLVKSADELQRERLAHIEADQRAATALGDLKKIASVKQEDRGFVVILPCEVLFEADRSELKVAAMMKLNQVGDALVKYSPDSTITIEGHTDSQGQSQSNKDLSKRRAESVANYLVSHGIARERIASAGMGASGPIADNASLDGRAQNHRIEIVVSPPASRATSGR